MKAKRLLAGFVAMVMTMGMMSSLVFADESESVPEEKGVVETAEPKEKETKKPEEKKPAETKEAEPEEKEPAETSKAAEPSESEDKKTAETKETEPSQPETTEPSESKKEEPSEPEETEPAQTSKPEDEVPPTTDVPEESRKEDAHTVPPKDDQSSDIEITSVSIILDAPLIGAKADYTATFPTGAKYYSSGYNIDDYRNNIRWYDKTTSASLVPDYSVFEKGHDYLVYVYLDAVNGYKFTGNTKATINGNAASVSYVNATGQISVSYTFKAEVNEITSVSVTLDAPAIGANPDYTAAFPSNANYYSEAFSNEYYENYIRWLDVTNNTFMYKDSAKFEGKHEYQVVLFLTAKEGYSFSNSTTATVNGNSAKISIDEAGHLRVSYNFPKLQLVNLASVEVRIDVPVAGSKPDYDLDFPTGALYYSENKNNQIYRNDIRWQDKTDNNKILDPDSAVFETGHEYDVYIYLTAKAGYKFSENTKCTLNGNEATLNFLNGDGDTLGIVYTFKTVLTEISSVSVTLNAPVAGAKPEYTAVLPSSANCYVETQATGTYVRNGIKWRDMSTSTDLDPDSDEFAVGHLYEVSFYLSAKDDYTISNNITVKINGQTATTSSYFGHLLVCYTFPALTSVNTLSVTPKTAKVKYKKLKKKKQTVARAKVMNVSSAKGNVTYKITGVKRGKSKKYKKYFKINATTGNVTIKKKLKKGTYKVTCVVTAAGDSNYSKGTKTVTFTIKVK